MLFSLLSGNSALCCEFLRHLTWSNGLAAIRGVLEMSRFTAHTSPPLMPPAFPPLIYLDVWPFLLFGLMLLLIRHLQQKSASLDVFSRPNSFENAKRGFPQRSAL
jgi:hypothetical protein